MNILLTALLSIEENLKNLPFATIHQIFSSLNAINYKTG